MSLNTIWECFSICVTYVVPLVALLISIISWRESSKGHNLQNRVNEIELKLKQHELTRIDRLKKEEALACVEARVINISRGKYRLKVWNSGQATAYEVYASVDEGANLGLWHSKMPFDFLEAGKSFEEVLVVHYGTAPKFRITTTWKDGAGQEHHKEQMGSL